MNSTEQGKCVAAIAAREVGTGCMEIGDCHSLADSAAVLSELYGLAAPAKIVELDMAEAENGIEMTVASAKSDSETPRELPAKQGL